MADTRLGYACLVLALLTSQVACKGDKGGPAKNPPGGSVRNNDAGDEPDARQPDDGGTVTQTLSKGEPMVALIGPEGGKLAVEGEMFSLEVPPEALKQPTEIEATPLLHEGKLFAIQLSPSGLIFEKPALGRVSVDPELDKNTWVAPILYDDSGKPEPVKKLDLEQPNKEKQLTEPTKVRFEVPHFSVLTLFHRPQVEGTEDLIDIELLTQPLPWSLPVGVIFSTPYRASLRASNATTRFCMSTPSGCLPFSVDVEVTGAHAIYARGQVGAVDYLGDFLPIGGHAFSSGNAALAFPKFLCHESGSGVAEVEPRTSIDATASLPNMRIVSSGATESAIMVVLAAGERTQAEISFFRFHPEVRFDPIVCTQEGSIVGAMALTDPDVLALLGMFKAGWMGGCVVHSDGQQCAEPAPSTAIDTVLDPVLQLGPNAAARFDTAFPCGEGPVGTTLCASSAPFAEGEWVYVAATVLDDLILDDPLGSYQLAFAFDADGETSNNYMPSQQYPGDFFAETDKWYEALYAPGAGWSLRVSDVRLGGTEVASEARFILAGRQLALLIPRGELDGDRPLFRVTAFRHEGDYGLAGGPWSASYAPALKEPLFEAARGTPFAVPE